MHDTTTQPRISLLIQSTHSKSTRTRRHLQASTSFDSLSEHRTGSLRLSSTQATTVSWAWSVHTAFTLRFCQQTMQTLQIEQRRCPRSGSHWTCIFWDRNWNLSRRSPHLSWYLKWADLWVLAPQCAPQLSVSTESITIQAKNALLKSYAIIQSVIKPLSLLNSNLSGKFTQQVSALPLKEIVLKCSIKLVNTSFSLRIQSMVVGQKSPANVS